MKDLNVRRILTLVLVVVIMVCCSASAVLGIRTGHYARAASTFFAGLSMSILILVGLKRPKGQA